MRFVPIALLLLRLTWAVDRAEEEDDDDDDDDDEIEEGEVGVRSMFDMFTRRLPGSLMLTSSDNGTGTVLGSWSNDAIASTVFQFYKQESSIVNGHNFGGWIMGGFMKFQQQLPLKPGEGNRYPSIVGGGFEDKNGRLNIELLMTQLWTSAVVRDNIITTFGFILNLPNNPLSADLYTSLMILYNEIRLRRISTLDVLPVLKRMSFSPPQEQFIILLEELRRHAPEYLKSPIDVWVKALTERRLDLNPIIRPGGGPSEVDFLASLQPSLFKTLEEKMFLRPETAEKASSTLKILMGPLFSYIFAGLYDRSIDLSQGLFAVILLHLPLDHIVPQKDETERYLVDALRLNTIENWDEVISTVSEADLLDPFRLIIAVLRGIASNREIDQQIRQDSLYILPYIKASTSTYTNKNYAIMSEVVGSPSIKFKLLLEYITPLMYSQDLDVLKDRLLDYVLNGYIDVESALTGFIRYDYTTPYDVLIAILSRIRRRLPNLSGDMLGTVMAFRAYLVFYKVQYQSPRHFPIGLIHVPSLLDAFADPDIPTKVRQICKSLRGLLDEERVDWESVVGDLPATFCKGPRQCFLAIMEKAIDENAIVNNRIVKSLEKILKILDEDEKAKTRIPTAQTLTTASPMEQLYTTVASYQFRSLPTSVEPISVPKDLLTKAPPGMLPERALRYLLPLNASLLDVIPKVPQLQEVAEIIENNTMPELQQLVKYFKNKTRAEALLLLLETILTRIPPNGTLANNIHDYINMLVAMYRLSRVTSPPKLYTLPPPNVQFPPISPNNFYLPGSLEQRESLLPYTAPFTPQDILMKPIRDLLIRPDLLEILGDDFKPSDYPTKFLLLQAILQKAISTPAIQENFYIHDVLHRYLEFIKRQAEETKPCVNWMAVLDALPHAKDDHEYKHYTNLREFITSSEMESLIKEFEVRRYPTRGKLLQNCLSYLLTKKKIQELPEIRAAIKYFVDKVYLDGFGAKAVEYIIIKQQVIRRTIDLQKAFQAIALNKLDKKASKSLKGVYKFFEKEFQPPVHLANYDLLKHKTKGEWLKAYFTYLAEHPAVSSKARENISTVIPYILLTGPGAESVD